MISFIIVLLVPGHHINAFTQYVLLCLPFFSAQCLEIHPCGCILIVHFFLIPRWYSTVWISTFYLPILLFMDTWVVSRLGLFWTKLPWTFYRVYLILSPVYFMWKSSCHQCWEKYGKIMVAMTNMAACLYPSKCLLQTAPLGADLFLTAEGEHLKNECPGEPSSILSVFLSP